MKKIKTRTAYASPVKDPDYRFKKSFLKYDENENLLEEEIYLNEGELESKSAFKYNEKGSVIEETSYMTYEEISETTRYTRDENDQIMETIVEYGDGSKTIKTHQKEGNRETISFVDDDDEFEGKEIIEYDDKGNILEKTIINEDNIIEEKMVYEREGDRIIKRTEYGENGEFVAVYEYTYDHNDNLLERIGYNAKDEIIESLYFTYDEDNNLVEQQLGDFYIVRLEYDEKGNVITEERCNLQGGLEHTTTYEYDEEGNILKENAVLYNTIYEYEFYDE